LNWKNKKKFQNTIHNITYAVCLQPTCRTVIRLIKPDINSYFHIASTYSNTKGNVSANQGLCDKGKMCIPANSRNVSQANCYCGGRLNQYSGQYKDDIIEYYSTTSNVIQFSLGKDFDQRNGYALIFILYDCLPPHPTTSELFYLTWSHTLDILIWT
jgi:hypothetical protein